MAADELTMLAKLWDVGIAILAVLLGFVGFNIKKNRERVDELEKSKLDKEQFNTTIQLFREDITDVKRGIESITTRIDRHMDDGAGK